MGASTTQGTGNGSASKVKPAILNGVVKTENIAPNAVVNSDVTDNAVGTAELAASAVTTAKIAASAVTTAKIAANAVTVAKMSIFKSTEQTGTSSNQNIAHGLGVVPGLVIVYPTDTNVATTGDYIVIEGTHTTTNVVVNVTTGKKFKVVAFA
jgi:hypothetical protein